MPKLPPKSATNKVGTYGLVGKFAGYRARSDHTMETPNVLVSPSQNMVMNTAGRVATVKGYALDGAASAVVDSGILSHFDFINFKGDVRNMRAGFMSAAANDGKLQFRYVGATGTVSWVNLMTSLTSIRLCFCNFWDTTNLVKDVLWVDGSSNMYAWNGSVATFASATAATVTKQGSKTWAQEGFSPTGSITINGVTATYSGGYNSTTLTGVSVDFSATAVATIIPQTPITTALSAMTNILSTFTPTVIGCGRKNQVYVGSSTSNNLYISKTNSYTDYSFTTPVRIVGEGCLIPLDSSPVKFIAQQVNTQTDYSLSVDMAISEGLGTWAVIRATLSADLTKETLEHIRIDTPPLKGAQSERLCCKMENNIMFVANDNSANFFGQTSYQSVAAINDFSYPIIDDMNSYDFTDGSIFYDRNFAYITIPKSGIIRIYNMTDQTQQYSSFKRDMEDVTQQPWFWESPVTYPISGFYYTPDKGLCGHGYNTSESYELFTGGSLNGQEIDYNATFAFDDKGDRTQSKGSDEIYVEGYIKQNTEVTVQVASDLDSFQTSQSKVIDGSDPDTVAFGSGAHSLGKNNLGSQPLGGAQQQASSLPAWFHVIKTYVEVAGYLEQTSFSLKGIDLQFELLTFGTNSLMTAEGNNAITQ